MEEVRALLAMDVHAALGMAIYTGRLSWTIWPIWPVSCNIAE